MGTTSNIFLEKVKFLIDLKKIDYVVVNHAEPDHSGALPQIMAEIPEVPVIVSPKGVESVKRH